MNIATKMLEIRIRIDQLRPILAPKQRPTFSIRTVIRLRVASKHSSRQHARWRIAILPYQPVIMIWKKAIRKNGKMTLLGDLVHELRNIHIISWLTKNRHPSRP